MPRLVITHIDYLVTVDPSRRIIRDGAIAIADGRITAVGKTNECPALPDDEVIDGRGKLALPGYSIPTCTMPNSSAGVAATKPIRGQSGCSAGSGRSKLIWIRATRCALRGSPSLR